MRQASSLYRIVSIFLAAGFAAFGLLFVLFPDQVQAFPQRAVEPMGNRFFAALSAAYLYLLAALAWSMYRRPDQPGYPLLLCQAKGVSSLLLLGLFFLQEPLPVYLAKGVVDAGLAFVALALYLHVRRSR